MVSLLLVVLHFCLKGQDLSSCGLTTCRGQSKRPLVRSRPPKKTFSSRRPSGAGASRNTNFWWCPQPPLVRELARHRRFFGRPSSSLPCAIHLSPSSPESFGLSEAPMFVW